MDTNYEIGLIRNEITDLTDGTVEFSGGGKGQVASVTFSALYTGNLAGTTVTAKGTSRYLAIGNLLVAVQDALLADLGIKQAERPEPVPAIEEPELAEIAPLFFAPAADLERATVEQSIEAIRAIFPGLDIDEEDDDRAPGPKWLDVNGVMTLTRIVPCVGECMAGRSDICECRCDGANHGIANGAFLALVMSNPSPTALIAAQASVRPVLLGEKTCLCGCGGTTQRRFVPGHDARYHAAQKRAAREASLNQ